MLLKFSYPTKETVSKGTGWYSHVYREAELQPVRIIRFPKDKNNGRNNRYYYEADYVAPPDAESLFIREGLTRRYIDRKVNPHFNPKKIIWNGNIAAGVLGVNDYDV